MSKEHLSRKSHYLSDDVWWYENNGGANVYVRVKGYGIIDFEIPVASIRAYLRRKDKKGS